MQSQVEPHSCNKYCPIVQFKGISKLTLAKQLNQTNQRQVFTEMSFWSSDIYEIGDSPFKKAVKIPHRGENYSSANPGS